MTRQEYLQAAKARALVYLERGDLPSAVASLGSDLDQNPETKDYPPALFQLGLMYVLENDPIGLRRWIMGFH